MTDSLGEVTESYRLMVDVGVCGVACVVKLWCGDTTPKYFAKQKFLL